MVEITIATEATPELHAAMERLVPQLSKSNPPPSMEALNTLCRSEASTMFIATDETGILGTLTLAMFRIPTGIRAWIEDVIVDDAARGKGVGRLLNEAAIAHAFDEGAITVDLTSRPSRGGQPALPAHRLRAARDQRLPLQQARAARELSLSSADSVTG